MGRILFETSAMAAAAPRFERDGFELNYTRPTEAAELDRKGNFNPTLAVIVSAMIVFFFLVGFATSYFRRWILGAEDLAENDDFLNRRRHNFGIRGGSTSAKLQRGLDPAIVSALPLVEFAELPADQQVGKYFDCPVCLDVFDPSDRLRLLPQCAHAFHSECIDEWFRSHTTCPLCRACLAHPDHGKGVPSTEERDAENGAGGDRGIRGLPDFDIVEVVIAGESSGAAAISGFSQEESAMGAQMANTSPQEEQQEESEHLDARSESSSTPPIRTRIIRIATSPAKAAMASFRRSSSVGTGLHTSYVADGEGTQRNHRNFQVYAIVMDDPGDATRAHVSSTRWSFPNLRQIAPL